MAVRIVPVPRAAWGWAGWATQVPDASLAERRELVVHWCGDAPPHDRGADLPRWIDRVHRGKGWAGCGYNFVVGQDGVVWEGRGWGLQGAHVEGRNRSGLGVLVGVGRGGAGPTPAALATVRALADEADERAGRRLRRVGHRDLMATECPGPDLAAWIRAGMPTATPTTHPREDEMDLSEADVERVARRTAALIAGVGALHPVVVTEGTGAAELPDGRDIDAIPTVLGELQAEQARQGEVLARIEQLLTDRERREHADRTARS